MKYLGLWFPGSMVSWFMFSFFSETFLKPSFLPPLPDGSESDDCENDDESYNECIEAVVCRCSSK